MNKEIKRILNDLKECSEQTILTDVYDFYFKDVKILYDYITDLQQENKRLKDNIDWWKDRFFGQQEYDDSHRITAIEYKKRIDKAIEYINHAQNYGTMVQVMPHLKPYVNGDDLLNILQNGSDSQ